MCILFSILPNTDKGPKRDFSGGKKVKKADADDDRKPRNSLRVGSSSKKGRSAEMNMTRGSLKKKNRAREKELKEERALERRTVNLPEYVDDLVFTYDSCFAMNPHVNFSFFFVQGGPSSYLNSPRSWTKNPYQLLSF